MKPKILVVDDQSTIRTLLEFILNDYDTILKEDGREALNWIYKNETPDLILIDGRFRVLCFLTSLKFSPKGTKILFDDYRDRQFYHIVEEFCPIIDRCGRQALFESTNEVKEKITDELLLSFYNVAG